MAAPLLIRDSEIWALTTEDKRLALAECTFAICDSSNTLTP